MNALVLGGGGHVGSAIVRALLARGHRVLVVGRRPRPPVNLAGLPIRYRRGDAADQALLRDCTVACDAIIDAAAPYPAYLPLAAMGGATPTGVATTRRLLADCQRRMRAILDAAERRRARFVHIGSFTTSAVGRRPLDRARARWVQRLHPYFVVKARMESMVLAAARAGLPALVVNPSACLGPWDSKPRELCTIPRLLAGEWMPALDRRINVIDVRDVAELVSRALEVPLDVSLDGPIDGPSNSRTGRFFGRAVVLSGHNLRSDELADRVCELAHRPRPRRYPLPIDAAVVMAYAAEVGQAVLAVPRRWPSLAVMLMAEQRWLPESRAMARLGVRPRPLVRTLVDTIAWYRQLGYC